jgi:hypothetical protein
MSVPDLPQIRVVATREPESRLWTFHLVNDGPTPLASATLEAVKYEWGDEYRGGESPKLRVQALAPGAEAIIWHDDGRSEMRTDLWLTVTQGGVETWLYFEFPKLYRQQATTLISHPNKAHGPPSS